MSFLHIFLEYHKKDCINLNKITYKLQLFTLQGNQKLLFSFSVCTWFQIALLTKTCLKNASSSMFLMCESKLKIFRFCTPFYLNCSIGKIIWLQTMYSLLHISLFVQIISPNNYNFVVEYFLNRLFTF